MVDEEEGGPMVRSQWTYTVTSCRQVSQPDQRCLRIQVDLHCPGHPEQRWTNWRVGDSIRDRCPVRTYTITVEEEDFGYAYASEANVSHTTPLNTESGTLDVGGIVGALVSEITALDNYTATPIGNVIHVERTDGRDFNIQTRGGTVNNALFGIKTSVNDITLLPNQCVPGVVLLVRNSPTVTRTTTT